MLRGALWLLALPLLLLASAGGVLAQDEQGNPRPERWWDPAVEESRFSRHSSAHYELITDLPAARAELILAEMERNLTLYRELLACLDPPESFERLLRLRIFAELADYQAYHRERWSNPIGASFAYHHTSDPSQREAVGFFVSREAFFAGMRHEGFHQVFRMLVHFPPQWINEGLAEYCEAMSWCEEEERFEPRLHSGWARQLREFIGEQRRHRFIDAEELIRMSKAAFDAEAASSYAGAWALVWLLRHELDEGEALLERYLTALSPEARRGENERKAWEATFGDPEAERLKGLQAAYERFHAEVSPTSEYARFQEALRFVLAREYSPAVPLLDGVLEADSDFYPAYYFRGVALRAQERHEAALSDALRAIELFPQYTSALRLAIDLSFQQGQLALADYLARRLKLISERFRPQARTWLNRIDRAREAQAALGEPRPLPCEAGWPPLEPESEVAPQRD